MDLGRIPPLLLLILVFVAASDARALMAEGAGGDTASPQKVTPPPVAVPSPVPVPSEPSQHPPPKKAESPPDGDKSKLKAPNIPPPPPPLSAGPPPKLVPPGGPETKKAPPQGPGNGGGDKKGAKGGEAPPPPPPVSGVDKDTKKEEVCDASDVNMCHVDDYLVACLRRHPRTGKEDFDLLVQNAGENSLIVKVIMPASIKVGENKKLTLSKHSNQKINFQADATKVLKIVLDAGKGNCVLMISPSVSQIAPSVSDWNRFQQLPAFASRLTPMYGAYFLFVTVVIAGGTWACCKFRRRGRRTDAGIPYQQLEMGMQPQADSAVVETSTTEGWDQGWDDDWDDEEAAPVERPPDNHPTGSHSSNGLPSKAIDKNGWDDDWDD